MSKGGDPVNLRVVNDTVNLTLSFSGTAEQ